MTTLAWAGLLTSITSTGLLDRGSIGGLEWGLMFLASLLAGMIIVEARIVILASVSSMALTSFMSYLLLTMPVFLGRLGQPALENIVVELALVTVFTSMFPVPVVVAIVGGVVGGLLSERLGLF